MRYRRIALKAPVPLVCGCVALGLTLSATALPAAAAPGAVWLTATASIGQADGSARRASEDLLREAAAHDKGISEPVYAPASERVPKPPAPGDEKFVQRKEG